MAKNAIDWVWEYSRSENAARIVLLALAHEANREGETEMSDPELAVKCRLGERTVRAAVTELTAAGEIYAVRGSARGRPTRYRLGTGTAAGSAAVPQRTAADPAAVTEPRQNLPPSQPRQNLPPLNAVLAGQGEPRQNLPPSQITDMFVRSTGISEVPLKQASEITRPDVEAACVHLADRIEANGSKRPAITKRWRDAARLMLDKDGRTEQQLSAAIEWCQDHEFWRANILSMPKLREKYDQLRLQAVREAKPPGRSARKDAMFDRAMERAEKRQGNDANGNGDTNQVRRRMLPAAGNG